MESSRDMRHVVGWVGLLVATIGSLGWALVGLFQYSAASPGFEGYGRVQAVAQGINTAGGDFGTLTSGSRVVYTIVGVAGLITLGVFVGMVTSRLNAWRVVSSAAVLVTALGAINWGLIGLFKYDLVADVVGESFGVLATSNRVIYTVIGVAGLVAVGSLVDLFREYFVPAAERPTHLRVVEPTVEEHKAA
jgi:uncharacterized protein